jgi:Arabinofuranosyltransferase N terminal/Arabinofuranosyltransferase A C terminal
MRTDALAPRAPSMPPTPPTPPLASRVSSAAGIVAASLALSSVAVVLTRRLYADPFTATGRYVPLGLALACAAAAGIVHRAWGERAAGGAGIVLVSGWLAFFTTSQLVGTPFGYGGLHADTARLSALVTRFTVSTASADQFIPGMPSEYPPLFPWLVGKVAVILDVPAWRVLAPAAAVLVALSAASGYLLWRRILRPPMALLLCLVPIAVYGDPRKAYEVLAASVLLPWVVTTLGRGRDGRPALHWLPAGVVGGLMVADYPAYLVMSGGGLAVLVVVGLWRGPRWPYLRHLVLTALVAAAVSAWYVGPWLVRQIRDGGDPMADRFPAPAIHTDPLHLPWQHAWPVAILLTAGLALLVAHARREVWARCLLAVALSALVYRWLNVVRYHHSGHSGFLVKTGRISDAAFVAGFLLGSVALWPALQARLASQRARRLVPLVATAALAATLAGLLSTYWQANRVQRPLKEGSNDFAMEAHGTPLPDGRHPRYWHKSAVHRAWFPAEPVRRIVESVYGRGALPVALSYDEKVSAFYPFFQYVGTGAYSANSLSYWRQRVADVRALAAISDPDAFAARSAAMRFGQIDVFVLFRSGERLAWAHQVAFRREQFDPRYFVHVSASPRVEVFVRRGAVVRHADYPR